MVSKWDTDEGRRELSDVTNEILSRHKPIDREWRVPPEAFLARRDSLRNVGKQKGYDVIILYGQGADPSSVVWSTGYKTLFCEVAVALGSSGQDAFLADPELFRTVQEWAGYNGLDMESWPLEGLGLTDEFYTFVPWMQKRHAFELLSKKGPNKKIKVAIATPDATVSHGFYNFIKDTKNTEVVFDGEMLPPLMFEKDKYEIEAAKQAAYLSGIGADVALGVARPGLYETQVAAEVNRAMLTMGTTDFGWEVLLGSGEHNKAILSDAQNRIIRENDWFNFGASAYANGIAGVERGCVKIGEPDDFEREVYGHVVEAFNRARKRLEEVVADGSQMRWVDAAFREYLSSIGIKNPDGELVNLGQLIAYSGAHDLGCNECGNPHLWGKTGAAQPFSLHHAVPKQLMGLDIAIRGYKESPEQPLLGKMDYVVIEKTAIISDGKVTIPQAVPIGLDELQKWQGTSERPG